MLGRPVQRGKPKSKSSVTLSAVTLPPPLRGTVPPMLWALWETNVGYAGFTALLFNNKAVGIELPRDFEAQS